MRRQYPNSDSIKIFKSIRLYLRLIKFDSLISFLPAFLHKEDTHSMKYIHIHTYQIILIKLLSILNLVVSFYYFPQFCRSLYEPKHFHFYFQKRASDICHALISYYCFQTTQYLGNYRVLTF